MSTIQQMYCTHCTHGSSALERRQGELAARMLGYSVRAGSLEGDTLRQVYRQIERYVSYHLPQDTPAAEKLRLTADSAPRRMVFIPAAGSWQVIGQVCYRQRDTQGRPGSYFAHLLCRKTGQKCKPWTLLDALRLWGASEWVAEDSDQHPFVLPAIHDLGAMLADQTPAIDDSALLAFLRGDDRNSGSRLPDRWRDLLPTRRVEILQRILGELLTTGTTRRQTLLVAVEPEVAALLFYGVGRLLPPGTLRASLGVSTFEASTDRLTTALAATTFCDPATAEFRCEALRGRGIALNTFSDSWDRQAEKNEYAEAMIRRLLDEGPDSVDRRLALMAAAGPERIESLENFARTEQTVAALFQSTGGTADLAWRSDAALTDFARRLVQERLASLDPADSILKAIGGGRSLATILELATTLRPGGDADPAVRFLLEKIPDSQIAALLAAGEIHESWKIELLSARIASTGTVPPGCEWIWDDAGQQAPLALERRKAIAGSVIAGLPAKAMFGMLASLNARQRLAAIERLLDACRSDNTRWAVFAEVVRRLDVAVLIALWQRLGSTLFELPDSVGGVVAHRLQEILNALPKNPGEFSQQLDFLEAGQRWFSDSGDRGRLAAWTRCREAIAQLVGMEQLGGGWRQLAATRRFEAAAQRMTESAVEAMPADLFEDDRPGTAKQECLRAIGQQLLGGAEFLPATQWQNEAIWQKIRWRFEMGSWPSIPLRKLAKGPADRNQIWISVGIATAVVLGTLVLIGLATVGTGSGKPDTLIVERPEPPPHPAPAPQDDTPAQDTRDGHAEEPSQADQGPPVFGESPVAESPISEPVLDEPEVFGEPVELEQPFVPIAGEFAAEMSPVSGLKRPAVAVVGLQVRGVGGETLPRWILQQYTIGALVREQGDLHPARYLDFPDLMAKNEAQLFDGANKVLVQFRFAHKRANLSPETGGITAASLSWAEIPVQPARRYDIQFALSPAAVAELERLAKLEQ